jgi:hypothetical protein
VWRRAATFSISSLPRLQKRELAPALQNSIRYFKAKER